MSSERYSSRIWHVAYEIGLVREHFTLITDTASNAVAEAQEIVAAQTDKCWRILEVKDAGWAYIASRGNKDAAAKP
jgi:hypothetical protein